MVLQGLPACGLLLSEEAPPCAPVRALVAADMIDLGISGIAPTFCEVTTPYRFHALTTVVPQRSLAVAMEGYDSTWTVPNGSEIERADPAGIEMRMGRESGDVCVSHSNACTEPGLEVCRPLTVVSNNVWTAVAGLPIGTLGALAQDEEALWWVNPMNAQGYGVWRLDKATLRWAQVSDSFPEGNPEAYEFQGGAAIVHDGQLHYLADGALFLFDTVAHAWRREGALEYVLRRERTPLVADEKLWVMVPGAFWVYDPATRTQRYLAEIGDFADGVAFEVQGKLVFGAGRNLFADWRQPASWQHSFTSFDPISEESSDYKLELPALHFTQALDLGDTTILLSNDGPNFLIDELTQAVTELETNPALGCAKPVSGERHGAWRGAALGFDGIGLVVGGEYDTGLGVMQARGARLYFP